MGDGAGRAEGWAGLGEERRLSRESKSSSSKSLSLSEELPLLLLSLLLLLESALLLLPLLIPVLLEGVLPTRGEGAGKCLLAHRHTKKPSNHAFCRYQDVHYCKYQCIACVQQA